MLREKRESHPKDLREKCLKGHILATKTIIFVSMGSLSWEKINGDGV